jgi:hypothetical protein
MIKDGIEEGRTLDYKAADALKKTDSKKNEISKDVSAFANSNGGVIIYGVREFDAPNKRHRPEKIDPVKRDEISKEWLEQIIQSKIQPKIEKIKITPIEVSKEDNTVIYIVEIPQSYTAHQAAGHKYYKRYNFESVPMEDYEIRDVMNRGAHPELALDFEIVKRKHYSILPNPHADQNKEYPYLKIRIINKGRLLAKYVNYLMTLNKFMLEEKVGNDLKEIESKAGAIYVEYYGENTIRDYLGKEGVIDKHGPSRFDPILPGMHSRSDELQLLDDPLFSFKDEIISWTIYADNAPPMKGSIKTSEIKNFSKYYL